MFVNGARVASVADEPLLRPGINAVGITYDLAHRAEHHALMTARQGTSGKRVNRMLHIDESGDDLLAKLEAIRLVCKISGCAQRYLTHDAFCGLFQATKRADAEHGTDYHQRFVAYMHAVQDDDLTLGVAMTDAKGDRAKRPGQQENRDAYVHVVERRPDGIVIRGTKAIVTGAPYMHAFLVMPCRTHVPEDADFAVACAVPVDAEGVTIVARPRRPPGRGGGEILRHLRPVHRRRDLRRRVRAARAGCSSTERPRRRGSSPPATPPTTAIPASVRGPASATC